MSASARIGLGSAQFGSDYGITNQAGRVEEKEVAAILACAAKKGIGLIDTARSYGESERIIGQNLPESGDFRIVTKTARLNSITDAAEAVEHLRTSFALSLKDLGKSCLYGLLLHDPADLLGPLGDALWSELAHLKQSGLAAKIGVSIYEGAEIDAILDRFPIDIVQLPFNPIDQRLVVGGQLAKIHAKSVEIHARSLFLQGLLLSPVEAIPAKFMPVRRAVEQLDTLFGMHGLSRLEGLLAIAFARPEINRFIMGVTSTAELEAILAAADRAQKVGPLTPDLSEIDPRCLNPARWHEL